MVTNDYVIHFLHIHVGIRCTHFSSTDKPVKLKFHQYAHNSISTQH
ncbi:DUF2686 family protein [Escherichia coli]